MRRWFFTLAILCGMLLAPLSMASERTQPVAHSQAASHCAQDDRDTGKKAPAKPFRCMGACFGIETPALHLPRRVAAPHATPPIAPAAAPRDAPIAHDPPPPRPA